MRGVVLAGGLGTRLNCAPRNKHTLSVYDRPMVLWPVKVLLDNGVRDITIVSSASGVAQLSELLGSGRALDCWFTYRVQDGPSGVAAALACAPMYYSDTTAVVLGDNVFLPSPVLLTPLESGAARCYLYRAPRDKLSSLGVAAFGPAGLERVVEKPADPPSEYAVTGLYVFPEDLPKRLAALQPSARGEYEVSDLLDSYVADGRLTCRVFNGSWGDAGTPEGLAECTEACRRAVCDGTM